MQIYPIVLQTFARETAKMVFLSWKISLLLLKEDVKAKPWFEQVSFSPSFKVYLSNGIDTIEVSRNPG